MKKQDNIGKPKKKRSETPFLRALFLSQCFLIQEKGCTLSDREELTSLFASSGYSGKASGRFFGGFGGDFPVVFGLLPDENSGKHPLKSL